MSVFAHSKDFQKSPFLLREGSLRRIDGLVQRRLGNENYKSGIEYSVRRNTGLVHATSELDRIFNDENLGRERIEGFSIQGRCPGVSFELEFRRSSGTPVKYRVSGEDRDATFLLNSEFESLFENEIVVRQPFPRAFGWVYKGALTLVLFVAILLVWQVSKSSFQTTRKEVTRQQALGSNDLTVKLDYLIREDFAADLVTIGIKWFLTFVLFLVWWLLMPPDSETFQAFRARLYPINMFLIGAEKATYEQAVSLRSKWFWGVWIGFIVSFVAGLAILVVR
jgi:hypothetical protein